MTVIFTITVAPAALQLPWYAALRVLATKVMGSPASANAFEFEVVSFIVGVVVLLVLTAILGLVFTLVLRTQELRNAERGRIAAARMPGGCDEPMCRS